MEIAFEGDHKGANLSDGLFEWNTKGIDPGNYALIFTATDRIETDTLQVLVSIGNVNRPPKFEFFRDTIIEEQQKLNVSLEAEDPDGDEVVITMLRGPEGAVLTGNVLSWTPTFEQAGPHELSFFRFGWS